MFARGRYIVCCMGFVLMLGPMSVYVIVIESFTAIVVGDDPLTGNNYFGTFSYDETALSGAGTEILDPVLGNLMIDFTFEGQLFNETNDKDFGVFPRLNFVDGMVASLDYFLVDGFSNVDFNDPSVLSISAQDSLVPDGSGGLYVNTFVELQAVPVPAAVWLFSSGMLGLIGIARRKKRLNPLVE